MFNTIRHIIRKEFLQFRRDRRMIIVVLLPPVIQLILLGYAANLDVKDLPISIVDLDNSLESRKVTALFDNSEYFKLNGILQSSATIDEDIARGIIAMALVIPRDFSRDVHTGETPKLQLLVDGAESNSATIGLNYVMMTIQSHFRSNPDNISVDKKIIGSRAVVNTATRVWYNPELKSRYFMVPGILGLLLMVITMILTSMAIVKEKEIGTIEQLLVSPVKSYELIIGKLAPFSLIALVIIFLVISVALLVFHVPLRGSLILLIFLCILFLMTTLGLGLFVSTIARNQQQAMISSVFFVMLPMIFLSGFVFPIENMPKLIQYVTYILPLRYFFTIIRGIFLKGVGLEVLWDEALALLIFGILILGLSALRFQKRLN